MLVQFEGEKKILHDGRFARMSCKKGIDLVVFVFFFFHGAYAKITVIK